MISDTEIQHIFDKVIDRGFYRVDGGAPTIYMCIALEVAHENNVITDYEYNVAKSAIKRFLTSFDLKNEKPYDVKMSTLRDELDLMCIFGFSPAHWFFFTEAIYRDWANRFAYTDPRKNGAKPKQRTLQQIFDVVIDSGFYGDYNPSVTSEFMCISLGIAYENGVIDQNEIKRAKTSIERYLQQYPALAAYLGFISYDSPQLWLPKTTAIYRNWGKRPYYKHRTLPVHVFLKGS